jgi:hypothetical protein
MIRAVGAMPHSGQGFGEEAGRPAHIGGLALAQADGHHHWPADRGRCGGDQRVQGLLAFQPADLGALFGVAIDLPVGGVDVDEHHLIGAGQ